MKSKVTSAFVLLAAFALLLSCQTTAPTKGSGPKGNIRIVKLTIPDCG